MISRNFSSQFKHSAPGITCPPPEETQVQQHFKEECDINTILRRIEGGADPSILMQRKGCYMDLTDLDVESLRDSFDAVSVAEEVFMTLSADVRKKFDDDPAVFMEYLDDRGLDSEEVKALFGVKAPMGTERPDNGEVKRSEASPESEASTKGSVTP